MNTLFFFIASFLSYFNVNFRLLSSFLKRHKIFDFNENNWIRKYSSVEAIELMSQKINEKEFLEYLKTKWRTLGMLSDEPTKGKWTEGTNND